jgi:hypothetical protein
VRYAFVPYSSSVNVGHLIYDLNPNYLVNSYAIQSRKPITRSVTSQQFDHWEEPPEITTQTGSSVNTTVAQNYYTNTSYTTSALCLAALPANTPWTNQGGSSVNTTVVINAQGQQVTTRTTSQPQQQTQYTCVTVVAGRRTTYRTYYYTYQRSAYDYYIETRDPILITVTNDVFDHWSYEQVTYNTSSYKAFAAATTPTGTNGTDQSSTWDGCIEERATTRSATFTFNGLTGKIDPTAATDLDIDTAPTGSDATKWKPMWPEVAYYRTSSSGGNSLTAAATSLYGRQAGSYCPARARLLAEMTKTEFDTFADSLYAEGNTYHDLGMIWGARISSPDGMWASLVNDAPANGGTVSRHLVFMTDGTMSNNYAIQTTYGIEYHDRRVTDDGVTNSELRHTKRYLAVCQAIKAKGIRIWVIAYSTGLTTELSTCASANSSFTANSSTQLNKAFQEIAKQVGELRITQ